MIPRPDPDQLLEALDPEQREVATALNGPVVVIAGAGTGKTRAITHRIAYGVASGIYNPTSVLAVTFTQRAAGEMRGRLQQLGVLGVQARTFHSAALRQAQYFWPKVHGGELPQVLDNRMSLVAEAASRLRLQVDTGRLRDLVGEISWAKVSNVTAEAYPGLAGSTGRSLASFDPETIGRVLAGYEEAKRDRQRIDFEDILLLTAALIAENPSVADQVRGTYRHLVVDEYQDVSPLQEALLNLWRGDRSELCVVGDPAQTIHSFAGARSSFLTGFARRNPGATVVRLVRDYRSTPQVVGAANKVMHRSAATQSPPDAGTVGLGAVHLEAQRPAGPDVAFVEHGDEAAEARGVADWLAGLAAEGVAYREMAVLFRINAQSPLFEQALADRKIPYLVRGGERFYQRPEVRQALLALRQAVDTADATPVVRQVRALFSTLGWTPEPPAGGGALRERWESLAALLSVAEDLAATGTDVDLSAVSAELHRRAETQQVPTAQGVTVSTLHSAKGLEWDAVAVVGVQEGTLPFVLAARPDQIEEERRLLYVGITRAREQLRLSWSRTRNGGGTARNPSRFLDGLRPAGLRPGRAGSAGAGRRGPGAARSTDRATRSSVLSASCRSCGHGLGSPAERTIGRHNDCPSTYDEHTLEQLKEWRRQEAAEQSLPAYCVFTDATLVAIAEIKPRTPRELIKVQGLGQRKASQYAEPVLAIIAETGPRDPAETRSEKDSEKRSQKPR